MTEEGVLDRMAHGLAHVDGCISGMNDSCASGRSRHAVRGSLYLERVALLMVREHLTHRTNNYYLSLHQYYECTVDKNTVEDMVEIQ